MPSREEEWQRTYDDLLAFLHPYGKNACCPSGDFWLVDDDWGEAQQKICVFDDQVATPEFVHKLQMFLSVTAPDWAVIIAFDVDDPRMPNEGMGISVSAQYVKYNWDLPLLRAILGNPLFFSDPTCD